MSTIVMAIICIVIINAFFSGMPDWAIYTFGILFFGGFIYMVIRAFTSVQDDKEKQIKETGIYEEMPLVHIEGLDYPVKMGFNIQVHKDFLLFKHKTNEIKLALSKIQNISVLNAPQLQSNSISVKNAVIGGTLFGGVGAAVGGMSGTKNLDYKFLVINYTTSDNEMKNIVFSPPYGNITDGMQIKLTNSNLFKLHDAIIKNMDVLPECKNRGVKIEL